MSLESKEKSSHGRIWLMITAIGVFMAIFVASFFGARLLWPGELPEGDNCGGNIRQLLMLVEMYADSSGGRYPMDSAHPTLVGSMQLLSNLGTSAKILFCPEDHRSGARPEADFKKLTTLNISYSYVPNLTWHDSPDSPVFLDRMYSTAKGSAWPTNGNHGGRGGNVGYNDGHFAWNNFLSSTLKDKDGKEVVLSP